MNADMYRIKFNGTLAISQGNQGDGAEAQSSKVKFFLEPNTTYEMTMKTWCMDGTNSGDWVNVGSFTTLPECENPTAFGVNWVEAEWAEFNWEHSGNPNGETQYMGELRESGATNWSLFAGMTSTNPGVEQPTNFKTKAGLTPGATYEYRIKTWCNTGDVDNPTDPFYKAAEFGPATGEFTTVPCPVQTENLSTSYNSANANGASHAFAWDVALDGLAPADRYIIQFTVAGANNWQNRTVSGGGTATGRNIGGFTAGTEYNWRVRTFCSDAPSTRWRSAWEFGDSFVAGDGARLASLPLTDLDVYPNPSRDVFNVMFNSQEVQTITVKVTNVIGEIIYQETLKKFIGQYTKAIDLRSEAKGVYTLQVTTESGGVNKKIALQ